jgi:hypothetical protein
MNNDQLQQLLTAVTDGLQRPAGAYALTPGQVDPTNPLDYSTSSRIKIWNEASAPCCRNYKEGRIKILAEQDKYHVGEGTNRRACAALLFKLLMQKAIIDTRATASLLRENLSSLDTYMSTVKSNIEQFNKYVKVNWEGLKARGESCDDLMINR